MTPVHYRYTRELSDRFGYTATWLPNMAIQLGDIGIIKHYRYEQVRRLSDFGIDFAVRPASAMGSLVYASVGDVSTTTKAVGQLPFSGSHLAQADAGMVIAFGASGAVIFEAEECSLSAIEDQHALANTILELHKAGNWREDYVVVTDLISAGLTSVVISSANAGKLELKASGNLLQPSLVDVSSKLQLVHSKNIATQILMQGHLTPLFKAKGIRRRLLRPSQVVSRGGESATPGAMADLVLGYVDYDDFED